ncbi:hypothetical protein [Massilia sp. H6]|jgi:hypothetical protein|uniref:Uncharacterized protein n=1 Tax=Massilia jejuensis TaxID=648894 RepID=A0ABW0PEV6_9BURK|nr:hypothetical protein [Massilia sp. H6]UVW30548.1 hypothetical protein NRS07_19695 [Massilia sp. H6]
MKIVLGVLLNESRHSAYHLVSVVLFLLGFFVALTATDLGPFAPLLVSCGIYLVAGSLLLQALFWLRVGLRKVLSPWLAT